MRIHRGSKSCCHGLHGSGEDSKVSLRIKRKILGFQEGVDGPEETVMTPIEQ